MTLEEEKDLTIYRI